ncbi:bifunctional DNA-formamidopyrimidine glycosylase/DNA-(apurinic or apyrimidinic site) lyase [Thiohalomonas denitrificans]|uniref:Formamidopyrimidine-DNA glycosylase n=1 Tax=Thiohalomonas denitrificans TaxID=415747 RepID=A0A1G5PVK1_9GAMM|nr:bifunctional DNA-formamidopyrimidine glycosylase/DNA-(apurinic or apyrimidinic site) lyase [Thiohalomonas denitrificans]SCZ53241.1 DNA-(apurinic or apyrimidinic site) lyase [Thiohalomonas denitrificans]
MPELPEVETTRRGIAPHITGRRILTVEVREPRLRWPVPSDLQKRVAGQRVTEVRRRGKYLLLMLERGSIILHLGMSGSLRVLEEPLTPGRHDHVDLVFTEGLRLRLTDPRRFGALLWTDGPPESHKLLAGLGPEPLSDAFDGDYLFRRSRGRRVPVKAFLMDARVVVGVGNIYANEALFMAGIRPDRPAGGISRARYLRLAEQVRSILEQAIIQGGTTLRDFTDSQGRPGYFAQSLAVYGRGGLPCPACGARLREVRLGQRSTVFCPHCQR